MQSLGSSLRLHHSRVKYNELKFTQFESSDKSSRCPRMFIGKGLCKTKDSMEESQLWKCLKRWDPSLPILGNGLRKVSVR